MVLLLAACTSDQLEAGEAATVRAGGVLEVSDGGGRWTVVPAGQTVAGGATVRSLTAEVALEFRDGTVRLGPHTEVSTDLDAVHLVVGEVLVNGSVAADVAGVAVDGDGVFRVGSRPAPLLRVYSGSAVAAADGHQRDVAALRQLDLSGRRLPIDAEPLAYRASDAWDAELLGEAIAFDEEAARTLAGLRRVYRNAGRRTTSFFARFVSDDILDLATDARGLLQTDPFDALLALALTAAAPGDAPALRGILDAILALRADGARWGLIAFQLGLSAEAVVAVLDARQERRVALTDQAEEAVTGTAPVAGGQGAGQRRVRRGGGAAGDGTDEQPPASGDDPGTPADGGPSDPPDGGDGDGDDEDPGDGDGEDPGGGDEDIPDPPETGNSTVDEVIDDVGGTAKTSTSLLSETVDAILDDDDPDKRDNGD